MARRSTEEIALNMTPMIDCVFQLIIFFVVSSAQQKEFFDQSIVLSFAPDGPAIEKKDPRTIVIEVDQKGRIMIGAVRLHEDVLASVLIQAVGQYGKDTPVQIRGDKHVKHESVRRVMDACGKAGIWKVSFVATKEIGHKAR